MNRDLGDRMEPAREDVAKAKAGKWERDVENEAGERARTGAGSTLPVTGRSLDFFFLSAKGSHLRVSSRAVL